MFGRRHDAVIRSRKPMLVRVCPKCGSTDVHRSRRRTFKDHLRTLVFMRPFRCFQCKLRFYSWRFDKKIPGESGAKSPRGSSAPAGEKEE
jgi:hypothetical protein